MKNQIEKLNFVRDGASRLPPGFRFQPTDEELVFQYLKCKILHLPLPASIIPDILNVSNIDPWDLPGDAEQDRYFFTKKETKYRIGNRINRTTPSGYWKATSSDKQLVTSAKRNVHEVPMRGLRKTLVFYLGKPPHGTRTEWFMHEFSLTMQSSSMELEDWLICHIYKKDTRNTSVNFSMDVDGNYIDTNIHASSSYSASSASSSSNSSGVTAEVSSSDRLEYSTEEGDPYNFYFQYRY